ncbi:MAG: DUF4424 family protein [Rhodospirillaceae bacterium]|nr:DUF4424 family protein [Rhodospirillaceae bacterium]
MNAHTTTAALCLVAAVFSAAPSGANDTPVSHAAGGLVLEATDAVRMVAEDLHIAAGAVTVTYQFETVSGQDETLAVAFPLPDIDVGAILHADPRPARTDSPNFVGFEVQADGAPVAPTVVQAAVTPDGRDITEPLAAMGVPLLPFDGQLLQLLEGPAPDPDLLARLEEMGALADGLPTWRVQTSFVWQQLFAGGRTVTVEHSYRPLAGAFLLYPTQDYRQDQHAWFRETWCADEGDWLRIVRLAEAAPGAELLVRQVDYTLTTGGNWAGPIGRFHLTIELASPDDLFTLCWDGLTQVSDTRFELVAENWIPTGDLSIAFVTADRD